jgi:hypothetical protein
VEGAFPDYVSKLVRRALALAVVARREFPTESMRMVPRFRPFVPFPKAVAEEVEVDLGVEVDRGVDLEVEVAPTRTRKRKRRAMTRARAKAAPPRDDAALRQRKKKALARLKVQESPSELEPPATVSLREGDVWARRGAAREREGV